MIKFQVSVHDFSVALRFPHLLTSSCSHSAPIRRSGTDPALWNVMASCTGRKARRSSLPRITRDNVQAVAPETKIVKLATTTNCHDSRRAFGLNVDPMLEIINAGMKRSAHSRLTQRHVPFVKRAKKIRAGHRRNNQEQLGSRIMEARDAREASLKCL